MVRTRSTPLKEGAPRESEKEEDNLSGSDNEANSDNNSSSDKGDTKEQDEAANHSRKAEDDDKDKLKPQNTSKTKNFTKKGPRDQLSQLLPGYTAPRSLVPATTRSLADLHKQAILKETASRPSTTSTAVSFKTGRVSKLVKQNLRDSTAGAGWFHMQPTPQSECVQRDLTLIRNRNYLNPKRFYKNPDQTSAIFQVGTVVDGANRYDRLTNRERRTNLVDEVLANPDDSRYALKKYKQSQQERTQLHRKRKRGRK